MKDDAKKSHKIDSFFTNNKSAGQSTSTQSVTEPELSELDHSDYVEPDVHEISPPKKKTQWLKWYYDCLAFKTTIFCIS